MSPEPAELTPVALSATTPNLRVDNHNDHNVHVIAVGPVRPGVGMSRPLFIAVLVVAFFLSLAVGLMWRGFQPFLVMLLVNGGGILAVIGISQRELFRFRIEQGRWPSEHEATSWNQELHGRQVKAQLVADAAKAFSRAERAYGQRISTAEHALKAAQRDHQTEIDRARKNLLQAEALHATAVARATVALESWRNPGLGERVADFKGFGVCTHALKYRGKVLPLAYAQATVAGNKLMVYAGGKQESVKVTPKEVPQALQFASFFGAAVAQEAQFEQQRPAATASATQYLAHITADTGAIVSARGAPAAAEVNTALVSAIAAAADELTSAKGATTDTLEARNQLRLARERAVEATADAPPPTWLPRATTAAFSLLPVVLLSLWALTMPALEREGVARAEARAVAEAARVNADAKNQLAIEAQAALEREMRVQATAAAQAGTEALQQQARSEAVDLLGQAVYFREGGQLGMALELARQANGKWQDYPDAQSFLAAVKPQATAQAEVAAAQARAVQQAAQSRQAAVNTYKAKIGSFTGDYATGLNTFNAQNAQATRTPLVMFTNDWKIKSVVALLTMEQAANEMASVAPVPPEMTVLAGLVKQLAAETKAITTDYGKGIDTLDARFIASASTHMEKVGDLARRMSTEARK